jgi:RNA polymerase sigma-70 factor, ECF subfamily
MIRSTMPPSGEKRRPKAVEASGSKNEMGPEEFGAALVALNHEMHFWTFKLVKSKDQREELVQHVLLKALENRTKFKPCTNLAGWVRTIMVREHINQIRKRSIAGKYEPLLYAMREALENDVARANPDAHREFQELVEMMNHLTQEQQDILWLVGDRHSYDEIAEIMGIPVGTVKSKMSRARTKLIALYKAREEPKGPKESDPAAP